LRSQLANRGVAVKLGSITPAIREEISKLNQVLHLLEGRAKKTTRAKARGKYQRLAEEELRRPKEQGGRRSGQGSRRD
jgi:hypothetical protein